MPRTLFMVLVVAFIFSQANLSTWASDWQEDGEPAITKIPRPAPPIKLHNLPPQGTSAPENQTVLGDQPDKRTAFMIAPKHSSKDNGTKPVLEGGISKYGSVLQNQGGFLNGSAFQNFQRNPYQSNMLQGSAEALLENTPPFLPLRPQATPPSMFRGWLEKTNPTFALSTKTMSNTQVLEVKGAWDDSGRTIRALGIPYTSLRAGKLRDYPLEAAQVMVINCAGNVPQLALQRIRDFVARGGFLLTTDWALDGVLRRAFPGYVEWNGGKTQGGVVDALVMDPDPVLLKGTVRRAGWKLDEESQTIRVLNPRAVRVLVRSKTLMLSGDDPDRVGILAVTFSFGRGQVLHLVGHFDNNSGLAFTSTLLDPAPGIGISLRQALASNFLVAALANNSPNKQTEFEPSVR